MLELLDRDGYFPQSKPTTKVFRTLSGFGLKWLQILALISPAFDEQLLPANS
jgi:hypothetical protein